MLNLLRKNTKTIIWVVIAGFAIWGAGTVALNRQGYSVEAGRVFGEKVTVSEFNRASRTVRLLTAAGSQGSLSQEELDRETWRHIILAREAKRKSIQVSDYEVTDQLQTLFGGKEGFDQARYEVWVKTTFGDQPRFFEEEVRDTLRIGKLIDTVRPALNPTEDEVWVWYRKTILGADDDTKVEALDEKRKSFQDSLEQWKKTFISFEESKVIGAAVGEIEARAGLKTNIPLRASSSASQPTPAVTVTPTEPPTEVTSLAEDTATTPEPAAISSTEEPEQKL